MTTVQRAHKIRLNPSPEQEQYLSHPFGSAPSFKAQVVKAGAKQGKRKGKGA